RAAMSKTPRQAERRREGIDMGASYRHRCLEVVPSAPASRPWSTLMSPSLLRAPLASLALPFALVACRGGDPSPPRQAPPPTATSSTATSSTPTSSAPTAAPTATARACSQESAAPLESFALGPGVRGKVVVGDDSTEGWILLDTAAT